MGSRGHAVGWAQISEQMMEVMSRELVTNGYPFFQSRKKKQLLQLLLSDGANRPWVRLVE